MRAPSQLTVQLVQGLTATHVSADSRSRPSPPSCPGFHPIKVPPSQPRHHLLGSSHCHRATELRSLGSRPPPWTPIPRKSYLGKTTSPTLVCHEKPHRAPARPMALRGLSLEARLLLERRLPGQRLSSKRRQTRSPHGISLLFARAGGICGGARQDPRPAGKGWPMGHLCALC